MNTREVEGGSDGWPATPADLAYHLDAVIELFRRVQDNERIDLLEGLLACVDWREMFGGEGTGFLTSQQLEQLRDYYRAKFADLERFYLAEQLSTELMTAMMASGDHEFSDDLKRLGRDHPALWHEIRTFFSRKEFATSLLVMADERPSRDRSR
ncbi:MAG TPA: hypothetical protein VMM78_07925 [Thermomicrobiales bacterium]|nr:hypothetical protein [Thermomicrobiales bacterium]